MLMSLPKPMSSATAVGPPSMAIDSPELLIRLAIATITSYEVDRYDFRWIFCAASHAKDIPTI